MARTSGPNCSSLGAPMPGIATSAASSARSCSAIAIRVLSVKTTNAGTVIAVAVAANTAKLEGVGVHALRHSAAMSWLESGVHIKAVADLLGHSSIAITGDVYGHTSDDTARAAVDGLAGRLGLAKKP